MSATRPAVFTALVAVQVFFGLHYIAAKYIMTAIPPRAWATLRITAAAILLMAFVLVTRRDRLPRTARDLAAIAWFSIFGVVINQVCFVEGLHRTATAHTALINTCIPVATLLFAMLAGREKADARRLLGIAVSMAGAVYLIGHSGALLTPDFMMGDILNMVNALSYSLFLVISKPILSRHSSLAVTAEMFLFGAMGITAVGLPELGRVDLAAVPVSVWWAGAFVVLFSTVATYILSAWALKRVDSSTVAVFIYLQPLIASILAVRLLGEPLGRESLLSAALIFGGLALVLRRSAETPGAPWGGRIGA